MSVSVSASVSVAVSAAASTPVATGASPWSVAVSTAALGSLTTASAADALAFDRFAAAHLTDDDRAALSATVGARFGVDGAVLRAEPKAPGEEQAVRDVVAAVALQRADGDVTPLRPGALAMLLAQVRRAGDGAALGSGAELGAAPSTGA